MIHVAGAQLSWGEIVGVAIGLEMLAGLVLAVARVMEAHELPRWWALFVFLPGIGLVWLALRGLKGRATPPRR